MREEQVSPIAAANIAIVQTLAKLLRDRADAILAKLTGL
jgi:hypothetical protein